MPLNKETKPDPTGERVFRNSSFILLTGRERTPAKTRFLLKQFI